MSSTPPPQSHLPVYHSPPGLTASTNSSHLPTTTTTMSDIQRYDTYSTSRRPSRPLSAQSDALLLPALLTAGAGVTAASLYYAYKRYSQYRSEQQLANLSWSIASADFGQLEPITDQVFSAFDDYIRSTNRGGVSHMTRDKWQSTVKAILENSKQIGFLAVDDKTKQILGSVFGDASDDDIVTLGPFSVLTQFASKGIARKLVQRLIDECLKSNPKRTLILTQSPGNTKAFALYSSLGFQARYSLMIMRGFVTKPEAVPVNNDIEVKKFMPTDIDDATALLQTTLNGINRRNYITNMLNPRLNNHGIGYVARKKAEQKLVGFTTAANSSDGIWSYDSLATLQALFAYASDDLKSYNNEDDYQPVMWLPQEYYQDFRWLLSAGLKLRSQFNIMTVNKFEVKQSYRYCPSAWG